MPVFNSRGDVCAGIGGGTASVNKQPIVSPAGSTDWFTDDEIVYQVGRVGWGLEGYHIKTKQFRALEHDTEGKPVMLGANAIFAGGGVWAAWANGAIRDSLGRVWLNKGLRGVGPDGSVVMTTTHYQVGTGITVVRKDGSTYGVGAGAAYGFHMPTPDVMVWTDGGRVKAYGLPTPVTVPGHIYTPRAVKVGNEWWLLYQTGEDRKWWKLFFHPWNSLEGYVIYDRPSIYGPDVLAVSPTEVLITWSLTEGERPQDIQIEHQSITEARVKLELPTPKPEPKPEPPRPEPTPMTPPKVSDITWVKPFPASESPLQWPVTARVESVSLTKDTCVYTSRSWPIHKPESDGGIDANLCVVGYVGGAWHAWPTDFLRPKKSCINKGLDVLGQYTEKALTANWRPAVGDLIGFFVAAPCRDGQRTVRERSDIVWVRRGSNTIVAREDVAQPEPQEPEPQEPEPQEPEPQEPEPQKPEEPAVCDCDQKIAAVLAELHSVQEELRAFRAAYDTQWNRPWTVTGRTGSSWGHTHPFSATVDRGDPKPEPQEP